MKKMCIVCLLVLAACAGYAVNGTRMEHLNEETLSRDISAIYYHDKVGGREFVCFYEDYEDSIRANRHAMSCQPTGREWK